MAASTLLSGTPAGLDERTLNDVVTITAGAPGGGMSIITGNAVGGTSGVNITSEAVAADTSLYLNSTPVAGTEVQWRFCAGGTTAAGVVAGHLQLFKYINTSFDQNVLDVAPNGAVTFPDAQGVAVTGGLAVTGLSSFTANAGTTTAGVLTAIQVAQTAITASSVVIVTPTGDFVAAASAVPRIWVTNQAGVGFTINLSAAPSSATAYNWWIAKL